MEEIDIREVLKYIRKYIILICLVVVVALGLVVTYDLGFKTPLYKTYTTLVLVSDSSQSNNTGSINSNDILLNQKLVSTYREIIKSKLVLQQVIDKLDLDYSIKELSDSISVTAKDDTEIINIAVEVENPDQATLITNTIAEIFSAEVVKIYNLNNVSVIDVAQVPTEVSNNTLIRDLVIGFAIAIVGSCAVIFLIYYFDDTIKYSDSLEEISGMPIVAKVINSKKETDLLIDKYPNDLASESIRTLRTNLQFSSIDKELKTILVTSSIPGEGKSFVSVNLACAFAQTGKKVCLVDCDLRKGRQHKVFGIDNTKGLSNLIIDDITNVKDYMSQTEVKGLSVIPRGTVPPNPSELLNSRKNKDLINALKQKFDIVILDCPPCNGLSDALIMTNLVDKVLVVASADKTPKTSFESTIKALENINAPIAGSVLNNIDLKREHYGKYYYYYGESEKTKKA